MCCAIISKLLSELDGSKDMSLLVYKKLSRMPNSGFAQIWLQRMLKNDLEKFRFSEKMCELRASQAGLWNCNWVKHEGMLNILESTPIFLQDEFVNLDNVISNKEIDLFGY